MAYLSPFFPFCLFLSLFTFPGKLSQCSGTVSMVRTRSTHSICKPLQSASNFVTDMGKAWCLPYSSVTCQKASWNIKLWHYKTSLLNVVLYQIGKATEQGSVLTYQPHPVSIDKDKTVTSSLMTFSLRSLRITRSFKKFSSWVFCPLARRSSSLIHLFFLFL